MKSVPAASNPLLGFTKLTPDRKSVESINTPRDFVLKLTLNGRLDPGHIFSFQSQRYQKTFT